MKKWMSLGLLMLAVSTGCVTLPKTMSFYSKKDKPVEEEVAEAPRRPSVVTPEQVTEANAREVVETLKEELDRDTPGASDGSE